MPRLVFKFDGAAPGFQVPNGMMVFPMVFYENPVFGFPNGIPWAIGELFRLVSGLRPDFVLNLRPENTIFPLANSMIFDKRRL